MPSGATARPAHTRPQTLPSAPTALLPSLNQKPSPLDTVCGRSPSSQMVSDKHRCVLLVLAADGNAKTPFRTPGRRRGRRNSLSWSRALPRRLFTPIDNSLYALFFDSWQKIRYCLPTRVICYLHRLRRLAQSTGHHQCPPRYRRRRTCPRNLPSISRNSFRLPPRPHRSRPSYRIRQTSNLNRSRSHRRLSCCGMRFRKPPLLQVLIPQAGVRREHGRYGFRLLPYHVDARVVVSCS